MPSLSSANGLMLAYASASFFGLNIVYAGAASFAGIPGSSLVVYRVLLMLALVGGAAWLMRCSVWVDASERPTILVLGVATAFVGLCYLSSVAFIPVTVAAVVFYAYPALIVLMSPLVGGARLTLRLIAVVGLALAGIILVVGPVFENLDWRGLALALAAAVATATQFFAASRCHKTPMVAKVFWVHLIVLPTALGVAAISSQLAPPASLALAPFAVAMTIGGYLVGFLCQLAALTRISAAMAGISYCVEPVVSAVASTFVLGETLTGIQIFGGALVLTAILANTLSGQQPTTLPLTPAD